MPLKDLIQNQLTVTDKQAIDQHIAGLLSVIAGKTISLSPEERQKYGSINEKNKLIVEKVKMYQQSQPQFNSPKVNWGEFEQDFDARTYLEAKIAQLQGIIAQLTDNKTLHDYDNYQDSLSQYRYIKYLASEDTPGIFPIQEDLQQLFPRTSSNEEDTTTV
ncbi:MAG: hypothetical protein ACKVTZ_05940 [Bacteroidia bacterium]